MRAPSEARTRKTSRVRRLHVVKSFDKILWRGLSDISGLGGQVAGYSSETRRFRAIIH